MVIVKEDTEDLEVLKNENKKIIQTMNPLISPKMQFHDNLANSTSWWRSDDMIERSGAVNKA